MIMQMESPVEILQRHLTGQRPMDGTVLSAAAALAERLDALKDALPMLAAVSFSPDVEAILAADIPAFS